MHLKEWLFGGFYVLLYIVSCKKQEISFFKYKNH